MVGTAGPSTGCQTCKNRRIKCDETRPACRRCVNSRRICPGYLEPFDIVFRDETRNTIAKYRDLSAPKRSFSHPDLRKLYHDSDSRNPYRTYKEFTWIHEGITEDPVRKPRNLSAPAAPPRRSSQPTRSPPKHLSPPVPISGEDIDRNAVPLLAKLYTAHSSRSSLDGSFFQHALQLYNLSPNCAPVYLSFRALALVNLPTNGPLVRKKAIDFYGKALKSTVNAMSDPLQSMSNEILVSIHMLAMYERRNQIRPFVSEQAKSYDKHLSGALSVLHDRGSLNWSDPQSRTIFRGLRSLLVMRCLQKSESPECLGFGQFWLNEWDYTRDDPSQQMHLLTARVAALRAQAKTAFYDTLSILLPTDVESMLDEAQALDQDLLFWHENLTGLWYYQSHGSAHTPSFQHPSLGDSTLWPGPVHIYREIFIAACINQYRMHRILVHMVVQQSLKWLHRFAPGYSSPSPRGSHSHQILKEMVDEICHSVPYHLGHLPDDVKSFGTPINPTESLLVPDIILAPLQLASNVPCISDVQRHWLQRKLEYISVQYPNHSEQVAIIKKTTFNPIVESSGQDFVLFPQHI